MVEMYSQFTTCLLIWFVIFIDWDCTAVCLLDIFSYMTQWHCTRHILKLKLIIALPAGWLVSVGAPPFSWAPGWNCRRLLWFLICHQWPAPRTFLSVASPAGSPTYTTVLQIPIIFWLNFANSLISSCLASPMPGLPLLLSPPCPCGTLHHIHLPKVELEHRTPCLKVANSSPLSCLFNYITAWPWFPVSRISHYLRQVAPQTNSLLSFPFTSLLKPSPPPRVLPTTSTYQNSFRKFPTYLTAAIPGFSGSLNGNESLFFEPPEQFTWACLIKQTLFHHPVELQRSYTPARKQNALRALYCTSAPPTGPAQRLATTGAQ